MQQLLFVLLPVSSTSFTSLEKAQIITNNHKKYKYEKLQQRQNLNVTIIKPRWKFVFFNSEQKNPTE